MKDRRGSLRLRLFAGVLGAGLFSMSLLAITLLLEVRDDLYSRHVAAARERLQSAAWALGHLCSGREGSARAECDSVVTATLALGGLEAMPSGARCDEPVQRLRDAVLLCTEVPERSVALRLRVPLGEVQKDLSRLDARLLAEVAGALGLLVLLSVWLLERGVVRRLSQVDGALDALGVAGEGELLAEGGDALGRLGAAVNRLGLRLREERARTREQILSLQQANRLLADEKRALREAREDLARSERLASVGRLAAGVAHEVGNPISAVIAYAALLTERLARTPPDAQAAKGYAERIEREAARVDRILRDLLDLARVGQTRIEPVDLTRVVATARSLVEPQPAFSKVSLEVALPAGLPRVRGEEHGLVQVLVNLLVNAGKAGASRVRLTAELQDDAVAVAVGDDGSGIPPEVLPRLFEPFFTTAAPGQGTGLGLALCHATLDRLGGSISAHNAEPRGAVFTLRLRRWE